MIIPLRTDRLPKRKPIITEGLIVVNLLVYLSGLIGQSAGTFDLNTLVRWGHYDPQNFQWWQLFTSAFLHDPSGIWHIAFNMLFLWVFGAAVEDRIGRIGYLGFYLIGAAVTAAAHSFVSPAPVIGASGAIAAVTGAFLAMFPRSRIVVFFLIGFTMFTIPSLWFIGLYFVIDVLRQAGELLGGRSGGVAYMAHIAGYVYGFSLAFVLLGTKIIRRDEYDVFFLFTQARRRAQFRAANKGKAAGAWESSSADTGKRLASIKQSNPASAKDTRIAEARAEINRLAAANDLPAAAAKYRHLLREAPDAVFGEQRQLELANQFYADGEYALAAAAYELLLDRYPRAMKAAEVRLALGVLYTRQLNHPARAREVIESAKPALHDPRQATLADELLAELK